MAIGDQASNEADEPVERAAIRRVLNLREVLELIRPALHDGLFAQEEVVQYREQAVFHVFGAFGDELDAKGVEELFKSRLRDVATIGDELSKEGLAERRNWGAIIDFAV
jgi:hypothetical protein